ncbi:MAG: portal protein [Planctomycetota bacterium]|jgi:hypothetical protein
MNKRDLEAFKFFLQAWKTNWDLNRYQRDWYDEDLEFYRGYRNASDYPFAYNLSFNKLLPRVYTVLAQFMEQLYQAGTSELVSVRPRKRSDVDRAPRVQGLLNYQLETLNEIDEYGGSYYFNFKWMFNALTFGKGIAKLYWRKEERVMPRRVAIPSPVFENGQFVGYDQQTFMIPDNQVVYDGPYAEVLHNKMFNPHPHYKSIQKMPFVGCLYRRSIDYVKKQFDKGIYRNIKDLGFNDSNSQTSYGEDSSEAFAKSLEIEGALQSEFDETLNGRRTGNVDVIEGYGRYIFPSDETPYEIGSGYKIKGKESEAIVHIGNYKNILRLEKNTYGYRPFFDMDCYYHPELFWSIGLIRLGKDLQKQYDNMSNQRFQNVQMLTNQMLKVKNDSDIPPESLIWKPFGLVPVDEMDDVAPLEVGDMFQSGAFREQEQFFEDTISDIVGVYPYSMGQTPPRQEHVGTIYSLQNVGQARQRLLMMTMDHQGFRPFLKHMMLLNTWHLDPSVEARINTNQGTGFTPLMPEDMHVGYDFSARYTGMEPALGKQFRAQQLIQYAQMWQQSPFLQHHQFMKAILEMMDFHDSDRYLKTPEQVNQEMQQQAAQGVQRELMGMKAQDMLAAKQSQRELTRDVVKGLMK